MYLGQTVLPKLGSRPSQVKLSQAKPGSKGPSDGDGACDGDGVVTDSFAKGAGLSQLKSASVDLSAGGLWGIRVTPPLHLDRRMSTHSPQDNPASLRTAQTMHPQRCRVVTCALPRTNKPTTLPGWKAWSKKDRMTITTPPPSFCVLGTCRAHPFFCVLGTCAIPALRHITPTKQ